MKTHEEIHAKLVQLFDEMFEIEADKVTLEANLYEDLDIDSIDAVDLVVELNNASGKRMMPEDFQNVRTVGDVVNAVERLVNG